MQLIFRFPSICVQTYYIDFDKINKKSNKEELSSDGNLCDITATSIILSKFK